jgi:2-keto-4-pentenoate hydratase/2-oxohepta-3-ene-1,7-dioic acid hydratase in catechol pathway
MKWLRFEHQGRAGFGAVDGDRVAVHEGDMFDAPLATGAHIALANITWRTPCDATTLLALWNNFRAAAEKNGWATPTEPLYFAKLAACHAAHGQAIPEAPAAVGRVAYEGELAIVIGRRANAVSVADAPAHIFGYTCANDVTAIELLNRDTSFAQWTRAKSLPGFGVFGPVIETDFDVDNARLRTTVGGRERQHYALADMFFAPAELVSRISHDTTLQPGDVILCGTSLGVLPMKPGTTVEVEIDGIGKLSNVYGG